MSSKKLTYKNLIIIIIIIITIATILGISLVKIYNTNKVRRFISDMELLEEKVSYLNSEYPLWENYDPNEAGNFYAYLQSKNFVNANSASDIYIEDFQKIIDELNNSLTPNWNLNLDQILSNYYYFTPSGILENFNIENPNYYIIINFYTGNIICKNGIKYNGKIYYRHYDLQKNLGNKDYNNEVIPEIEIVENNGLNKKIKISLKNTDKSVANIGEIYYLIGKEDEDKKRCTELPDYQYVEEEKTAYFTINTSGEYYFIVEDTNYRQYTKISTNIVLCNKPILENGMQGIYFDEDNNENIISDISDKNWYDYSNTNFKVAYSKKEDGSYYVWIPRFIYKEIQDDVKIDFVYNTSQTSTTNKSTVNYKLPQIFEDDILGIWMNVENLEYYNVKSSDFFQKVLTNK